MANDVSLIPFELVNANCDNIHEAKEAYLTKRQHTAAFGFKSKRQKRWLLPYVTLYKYFVFYHFYLYFITFKFYPTKENPFVLTVFETCHIPNNNSNNNLILETHQFLGATICNTLIKKAMKG